MFLTYKIGIKKYYLCFMEQKMVVTSKKMRI